MIYFDSQNNSVKLLKQIGRGGEGSVYACADESLVGKIYHEPIAEEKAEKLLWMAQHLNPQLRKTTTWVTEVLRDQPAGRIVGFLMPRIKAKEIHELYSPKSRRVYFPDATWHFLIHAAANLARAFHNLHRDGHVMGDVNQGNCAVLADGTVKLIDCDSFSIETNTKSYPCEVGVTTHIPPELQGKNLRAVERTANHDNFGLAVIIFQLLFLGRHPFAGNYLGAEDKSLEDAIREHLFVYGQNAERQNVVRPPGTLSLAHLPQELANLFERAFGITGLTLRPEPREWITALENLAERLQQCQLNPGHIFYSKITLCPWCEIEEKIGLMLFPFKFSSHSLAANYKKDFDPLTIENIIDSFAISKLPAKVSDFLHHTKPEPEQEFIEERRRINKSILKSLALSVIYLVITYFTENMMLGIVLTIPIFLSKSEKDKTQTFLERRRQFDDMQAEYDYFQEVLLNTARKYNLPGQVFGLKLKIWEYRRLLPQNLTDKQNADMLDLAKTYNSPPVKQIENEITESLRALRASTFELRKDHRQIATKIQKTLSGYNQWKANIDHLGRNLNFPVIIFITSILFSVFVMFGSLAQPLSRAIVSQSPPVEASKKEEISYLDNSTKEKQPLKDFYTDSEIAEMTGEQRQEIVSNLISKAHNQISSARYSEAEKLLRSALKLSKEDFVILNLLGKTLYNQGKYNEALIQFYKVKKNIPEKADNFYIGMTYLNLNKAKEAEKTFLDILSKKETAEGYYNLGLAYVASKDSKAAARAFSSALEISPTDVDSLYQFGLVQHKIRDYRGLKNTYTLLMEQSVERASQLRKIVGKSVNLESVPDTVPAQTIKARPQGAFVISGSDDVPPPARNR